MEEVVLDTANYVMARRGNPEIKRIMVGDFSGDGHGMYETVFVKTKHTSAEIRAAFKKAIDESKLNNSDNLCEEWETDTISKDMLDRMGVDSSKYINSDEGEDPEYCVDGDIYGFVNLIIDFIKVYTPDLKIETISYKAPEIVLEDIGYGLFTY